MMFDNLKTVPTADARQLRRWRQRVPRPASLFDRIALSGPRLAANPHWRLPSPSRWRVR